MSFNPAVHADIAFLSLITLTFLAAGPVKGVTGMGLPTAAMGPLGAVMPPAAAAAILIIPSFVTKVWQLLAGATTARLRRRLWPMMLGIVAGTAGSASLPVRADPRWSGLALGVALVMDAGYALASPAQSASNRVEP